MSELAVKLFARAFSKLLNKDLPALGIEFRPDKSGWAKRQFKFTDAGEEPKRQWADSAGTRAPVFRTGTVGMMAVEVLWMGMTKKGLRAKVRPRGKTSKSDDFWVDGNRVVLDNTTPWKVSRGNVGNI